MLSPIKEDTSKSEPKYPAALIGTKWCRIRPQLDDLKLNGRGTVTRVMVTWPNTHCPIVEVSKSALRDLERKVKVINCVREYKEVLKYAEVVVHLQVVPSSSRSDRRRSLGPMKNEILKMTYDEACSTYPDEMLEYFLTNSVDRSQSGSNEDETKAVDKWLNRSANYLPTDRDRSEPRTSTCEPQSKRHRRHSMV